MKKNSIEDLLSGIDFSKDSNKEGVYKEVLSEIKNKEKRRGYKMKNVKPIIAAAMSVVIVGGAVSQTAFGKEIMNKILFNFNMKNSGVTVYESEPEEYSQAVVPENLAGKLYDSEGNMLTVITKENYKDLYTASGEKILDIKGDTIITDKDMLDEYDIDEAGEDFIKFENIDDRSDYISFEAKIPGSIPNGYEFGYATSMDKDIVQEGKSKYLNLFYKNDESRVKLCVSQRYIDESTQWYMTADDAKETEINGVKAVLSDGMLVFDVDDVNISISKVKGTGLDMDAGDVLDAMYELGKSIVSESIK